MEEYHIQIEEFNEICRICLHKSSESSAHLPIIPNQKPIINSSSSSASSHLALTEMIAICLGIKITGTKFSEYLPQNICTNCCKLIEASYNLRIKSWFADEYLRKIWTTSSNKNDHNNVNATEFLELKMCTNDPASSASGAIKHRRRRTLKSKKISPSRVYAPKQCPVCGILIVGLKLHMATHTDARPFQCSHCSAGFRRKGDLTQHIRTIHLDIRDHKCPHCERSFHFAKSLASHLVTHTGRRDYLCDICSKSFGTRTGMVRHRQYIHFPHMTSHECITCRKQFKCKASLNKHRKTHVQQRPFKCVECPKTFISNSKLQIHRRIHTGGRPYQCTECTTERFRYRTELTDHLKETHGITIIPRDSIYLQVEKAAIAHASRNTLLRPNQEFPPPSPSTELCSY